MKRICFYLSLFILGLFTGFLICRFQDNKPADFVSMPEIPIPNYSLLKFILVRNYTFALILFLLNDEKAKGIIIYLASLIAGIQIFSLTLLLGLSSIAQFLGIIPHGPLELLGFSLVSSAGYKYWGNNRFLKELLIGILLILLAALVESTVSLYILIHLKTF
ncbi:MAG: stage II sporulation protein M [Nitrososphaerota archaeon]|nr:stage II sporulation protein M [Nitrososphaerota archaeon]